MASDVPGDGVPDDGLPDDDGPLGEASRALEDGDAALAIELARRAGKAARKAGDDEGRADALWLEGAALVEVGEPGEAVARLDEALKLSPDHLDVMLERGHALFEGCRFEEARTALEAVLVVAPDEAWAHHLLGLLAERRGDGKEAERRFARARKLDPEAFQRPVTVPKAEFERLAEAALEHVPEKVRRYLANVVITAEDVPSDDDLLGSDPPLSPSILGLFRGAPYGQKVSSDPWSHLPSAIVLYQRNLERFAQDRDELVEQIGVTLLHEVLHFLGLDEEELEERGLD